MGIRCYQEHFQIKLPLYTNFKDEAVVQCDVPVVKILLSVLVIYKSSQINFDVNTYVLFLDTVLCIILVS